MSGTDTIQRDDDHDESAVTRRLSIERLKDGDAAIYRVSLSSETPVKDWMWGPPNVLVHSRAAVQLDHLGDRGLPFLRNHGAHDVDNVIGRIHSLKIENKRLVGVLRWSKANPAADRVKQMVDEGTITDMSISAEPITRERIEDEDGNVTLVRWTAWRPVEASAVAIGADQTVGIGRNKAQGFTASEDGGMLAAEDGTQDESAAKRQKSRSTQRGQIMDDQDLDNGAADEREDAEVRVTRASDRNDRDAVTKAEEDRISACRKFGEANGVGEDVIQMWIKRGASYTQIADDIERILKKRGESKVSRSALDLTERETQSYSLARAILAARDESWKGAEFEQECHEEIAKRLNKMPDRHTFFVPMEVQQRNLQTSVDIGGYLDQRHGIKRDLTAASASGGGYTVGTSIVGFDPLLRNISVLMRMGVTRLPGLRDNVTIPRQTASATASWLGSEADTIAESQQTFTQLPLTPKDVGGYTEISRRLLQQSSIGVEAMVSADLAAVVALAADAAGLSGSGADGQPTGLDNVTGIGSVSGTSLGFAGILEFQTDVATANVMPMRGGYVTTPAVAALMIQRVKYSNTASPLWDGNIWDGSMQGFPAMSSNQIATAVMYFGDWSKMVLAEWGTLEIDTNPYAGFTQGIIGIRALYSLDVGVRYPAAFSRAGSIT
jgi:HK97 family phage major capsid protein/HK97 family phage prohead protease